MGAAPRSERAADEERYLVVATIRKPHGVRGEVQVTLETDRPGAVFRKGRALELGDAAGRRSGERLTVEQTRPFKGGLLLKPAGSESREAAERFRGRTLLIPLAESAPAAEDEVPYHLLIGSEVVVAGDRVGTVQGIVEAGGGELLVVRAHGGREILIPFVKEVVRGVDRERREVTVEPPEGLLDL